MLIVEKTLFSLFICVEMPICTVRLLSSADLNYPRDGGQNLICPTFLKYSQTGFLAQKSTHPKYRG